MKRSVIAIAMLTLAAPLSAQGILEVGTWVKRDGGQGRLVLTIEAKGNERKLTYRRQSIEGRIDPDYELVLVTHLDGQDAVLMERGKPNGQTMAVKRLDARHSFTVIKLNGKQIATSRAELSADGKLMTVENAFGGTGGMPPGKQMEYWDRK